jgi:hypothetical protein
LVGVPSAGEGEKERRREGEKERRREGDGTNASVLALD